MNRILLIAALLALAGCSWFGNKNKSSARMYEGDSSPVIQMHEESPGSPLRN